VHRTLSECGRSFEGNAVILGSPLNGSKAASGIALAGAAIVTGPHVLTELAVMKPREWTGPCARLDR
jgi:hypothetical protein